MDLLKITNLGSVLFILGRNLLRSLLRRIMLRVLLELMRCFRRGIRNIVGGLSQVVTSQP